jgi:hypothetical protein
MALLSSQFEGQEALDSVWLDNNKIKTAWETMAARDNAKMVPASGWPEMCWPVEWFPEHMPVESATGHSIYAYLANTIQPHSCISNWPPIDDQVCAKEDIIVFSDSYGYCKEILEQAPPGRVGVTNIQAKPADKYVAKDIKNLFTMHKWDLCIFAAGIDPPASNSVEDLHKQQDAILKLYLTILQKVGDDASCCKRLVILTADAFADETEIHEECGIGLTTNGTLFGMTNTARQEVPTTVHYIDTEWALRTENTKYLVSEIFRHESFGYNTVRILNKGRYVLRTVPVKPYEFKPDMQVPNEGVIAITGGNGALALVMGGWLLDRAKEQGGKHFSIKFLSRSMKISDQNMPNWKRVENMAESLGIDVEQAKADCSKKAKVDEFMESVTPNLAGIIHSAGILQDSMLFNQTWEKFDAVLESKSRAALFVHDALERYENPGLEFFWMFSSCAVYGNMGQLNYSASNAYMDGLSRHRRALGKVSMAPQWGAWGDVGMAANLDDASRRRMANSPMPYFSNSEGLYGLECLLRSNLAYGCVVKFNPPLMQGMVGGSDSPTQCYTALFYSELATPPPVDPNKNGYLTLAFYFKRYVHNFGRGLVMRNFWPEQADMMLENDPEADTLVDKLYGRI